jgi:hypothetical protein
MVTRRNIRSREEEEEEEGKKEKSYIPSVYVQGA